MKPFIFLSLFALMILGQSEWLPQLTRINGNAISLICLALMIYLAFRTEKRKVADPALTEAHFERDSGFD